MWALGVWLLTVMVGSVVTFVCIKFLGIDILDPSSTFHTWHLIILGSVKASLFTVVAARANSSPASDIGWVLLAFLVLETSVSAAFLDGSLLVLAVWSWLPATVSAALGYGIARGLVRRGSH